MTNVPSTSSLSWPTAGYRALGSPCSIFGYWTRDSHNEDKTALIPDSNVVFNLNGFKTCPVMRSEKTCGTALGLLRAHQFKNEIVSLTFGLSTATSTYLPDP